MTEGVPEVAHDQRLCEEHTAAQRSPEDRTRLIDRALAIGRDCAERLARAESAESPDALLFDERGLPHDAGRCPPWAVLVF